MTTLTPRQVVDLEQVLIDCLEYFEDREDADHDGEQFIPNDAMNKATHLREALETLRSAK